MPRCQSPRGKGGSRVRVIGNSREWDEQNKRAGYRLTDHPACHPHDTGSLVCMGIVSALRFPRPTPPKKNAIWGPEHIQKISVGSPVARCLEMGLSINSIVWGNSHTYQEDTRYKVCGDYLLMVDHHPSLRSYNSQPISIIWASRQLGRGFRLLNSMSLSKHLL